MFWGGFFVGVIFLLMAGGLTYFLIHMLGDYIECRVGANRENLGFSKLDIDFLQTDVKYLKASRDNAIDFRQEISDSLKATDEVAREDGEKIDKLQRIVERTEGYAEGEVERLDERIDEEVGTNHQGHLSLDKRIRELQDRIDYFIGISPVGGMLTAKIVQEGIAIHKGTDKGAPFDGVTKLNDLVTIYEVKYVNDVQWAKIGDNKWICGGWRPRDPKKDFDNKEG